VSVRYTFCVDGSVTLPSMQKVYLTDTLSSMQKLYLMTDTLPSIPKVYLTDTLPSIQKVCLLIVPSKHELKKCFYK
jgi:hypothetical protein